MIWIYILAFLIAFFGSAAFKVLYKPAWAKEFSVDWNDSVGTVEKDLSYGPGEANKFDLYLPAAKEKEYGLVVYLHAGGFTSGDKSDDKSMLEWLCSKGYVAAGINYTLRTETNQASVLSQSNEIKEAIPHVIEAAEKAGYPINEMAMAGGSAGGALALIYAYRDAASASVPVKLVFEAVGPSSFYAEDWKSYGLDKSPEAAAELFSVMAGTKITPEQIKANAYQDKVKDISAAHWITPESVPTVVMYGKYDKVQPYDGSLRLKDALQKNGVDYKYFLAEHSGHGLQNDNSVYREYMETVEEYLNKYMPVQKEVA